MRELFLCISVCVNVLHLCVCVCVCVYEREREREREMFDNQRERDSCLTVRQKLYTHSHDTWMKSISHSK